MSGKELLKKYYETLIQTDKKEKQLNDICDSWNKLNQSDETIAKKVFNLEREIVLLQKESLSYLTKYNAILRADTEKRQNIINAKINSMTQIRTDELDAIPKKKTPLELEEERMIIINNINLKMLLKQLTLEEANELIDAVNEAYLNNNENYANTMNR